MTESTEKFATATPFDATALREFAEKGVTQARETYEKFKDAAQSSNDTIEAVYATATKGATEYTNKLVDIARVNANSAFDLAGKFAAVKSPTDIFSLLSNHAREQYEAFTAQTKDLVAFSQKVTADTVEPIKANASKVFSKVA
jgi:phasin